MVAVVLGFGATASYANCVLSLAQKMFRVLTGSPDFMAVFLVTDPVNMASGFATEQTPQPSVPTRLRLETRYEHEAVEKVLYLMGSTHTVGDYRQRLKQFYGFYGAMEAALQARCATPQLALLSPRLTKRFYSGKTCCTWALPLKPCRCSASCRRFKPSRKC